VPRIYSYTVFFFSGGGGEENLEGTFWKGVTDSEQCFTKSFICKTIILKNIDIPSNRYIKSMFAGAWEMEYYVAQETGIEG
jgi:hypothetical protein